jgi:hypothetical protein
VRCPGFVAPDTAPREREAATDVCKDCVMQPAQHRLLDWIWIVLGSGVVGVAALVGAFAGDTERIGAYWTHAHIDTSGHAEVIEVIDYDFGSNRKHGLLRQIPDVSPDAAFTVSSPSAPDQVEVYEWWSGTELRVGDPNATISNRHRYTITYPHDGLVFPSGVAWNAVGDGWEVTVHDIEVHLTSDQELINPTCDTGRLGDVGGCTVQIIEPGHVVITHGSVSPGNFLTVSASLGTPVLAQQPIAPFRRAPDPGSGWRTPALLAFLAALVGGAAISFLYRRLGREWVWDGGSVDAAFGPTSDVESLPKRRVDHSELADMTTIEFESPRDLSAALGGVVHAEHVLADHKTAWLLECAIREEIELDTDGDDPSIRRGDAKPNPAVAGVLDEMFGGTSVIPLGSYNPAFAGGWSKLETALEEWRRSAGFWDERGRRRRNLALGLGLLGLILGMIAVAFAAGAANRFGSSWFPVVVVSAVPAGAAAASLVRAWELRIRTPKGSGAWIRIESFRRFLHESEADHVERAAEMGLLRQYTAWAVALGEVDRWEHAVEEAAAVPGSQVSSLPRHTSFVAAAPLLSRSFSAASTAPSSSGGGGGGSGGGGGGGGGGSW